jgi:hypothetical protein
VQGYLGSPFLFDKFLFTHLYKETEVLEPVANTTRSEPCCIKPL